MALNFSRIINSFVKKAPDDSEYIQTVDIAPHGFDEIKEEYKVNVTNKTELLQSHEQYTGLITDTQAYVGIGIVKSGINTLNPIDVSNYPKRTVVIYNHHDQPIKFRTAMFYVNFDKTHREVSKKVAKLEVPAFNSEYNIPGSLIVDETNYPEINTALPGMALDLRPTTTVPTEGHLDIFVFGGV